MSLSKDQQEAVSKFSTFMLHPTELEMVLAGHSGSGKSYVTKYFIDILKSQNKLIKLIDTQAKDLTVHFTATTNKATKVLSDMVEQPALTIHKLLGLKVVNDFKTGNTYLERTNSSTVIENALIVIDECLHPSMEIMTNKGFIPIGKLDRTELIAQYNQNTKEISYVTPLRYITKNYSGNMISISSPNVLDISTTENHDVLCSNNGLFKKIKAKNILSNNYTKLKVAGKGTGISISLTDLEKLAIIYQADGSKILKYTAGKKARQSSIKRWGIDPLPGNGSSNFSFIKRRKIEKFKEDMKIFNPVLNEISPRGHNTFKISNIPLNAVSKNFKDIFDITTFSYKKAKEFIDYIQYWDGFSFGKTGIGYSNTNKSSIDFVQEVATLAGYRSTISTIEDNRSLNFSTCYKLHISTSTDEISTQCYSQYKKIEHYDGNVHCVTVPTGNIIVRRNGKIVITGNCSMIDSSLLKIIRELTHKCKVLYIGDPYQLAPIFETTCPVFNEIKNQAILTTIQRQDKNSPIITLGEQFRETVSTGIFPKISTSEGILMHVGGSEFEQMINDSFLQNKSNTEHSKVIAWTNNRVHQYNDHIRDLLVHNSTYQPGEYLVTNKPIMKNKESLYTTDEIVQIYGIQEGTAHDIDGWWITLSKNIMSPVFLPKDKWKVKQQLKKLAKEKNWRIFFERQEFFSDLRPIHAITIYKSQGSTYNTAFIDLEDIGQCTSPALVARMLYVGITRASDKVVFYGQLPKRYSGEIQDN